MSTKSSFPKLNTSICATTATHVEDLCVGEFGFENRRMCEDIGFHAWDTCVKATIQINTDLHKLSKVIREAAK